MNEPLPEAVHRVRMSQADAHYGGDLVDGARILALFGDVATELCVRHDGDEGLFAGYEEVVFLAPVHAGDFLEITARIVAVGTTSRRMDFEAVKYIEPRADVSDSAADALEEPVVVCRATGTCVVKAHRQRGPLADRLRREAEHLFDEEHEEG